MKPENILIGLDGIKISDFGVSHLFKEPLVNKNAADMVCTSAGSRAFNPPESLSGLPYCGYTADIWSLGVTLHVMVLGNLPFDANNVDDLFDLIERDEIVFPENQLTSSCIDLIQKMLTKSPSDRISLLEMSKHPWVAPCRLTEYSIESHPSREEIRTAITPMSNLKMMSTVKLLASKWKNKAVLHSASNQND